MYASSQKFLSQIYVIMNVDVFPIDEFSYL